MGKKKALPIRKRASVSKQALPDNKSAKVISSKRGDLSSRSKSKPPAVEYAADIKNLETGFSVVGIGASPGGLEALELFSTPILPDADIEVAV